MQKGPMRDSLLCVHVLLLQAIGDALMDEHNVAQVARPGTSLMRPATGTATVRAQAA